MVVDLAKLSRTDRPHRLLQCLQCLTLERVPPYTGGMDGNGVYLDPDPVLEYLIREHHTTNGEPHIGRLFTVDKDTWDKLSDSTELDKALWNEDVERAAFRDTLKDDAGKCYNRHNRPSQGCIDWRTKEKELSNPSHHPGAAKSWLCDFCFSGDTEVITREGVRTLAELAGTTPTLLVPLKTGQWCGWKPAPVKSFGHQDVFAVSLRRGRSRKVIRATAEHRWVSGRKFVATSELSPGVVLDYGQAPPLSVAGAPVEPSPFGVAQGFVYGDGSQGTGNRPGFVVLYGKKDDMLPYFAVTEPRLVQANGRPEWKVSGLPRTWKDPVDLHESRAHLLGWLAGYFAADGTVDPAGSASISSASESSLALVRDVCNVLGVMTYPVRKQMRQGFPGREPSALYTMTIHAPDLPESFWIRDHHARLVARRTGSVVTRGWTVESVVPAGREEVFCAVVPETEKFVLADGIVSGNCPVRVYVETEVRWKRGDYK